MIRFATAYMVALVLALLVPHFALASTLHTDCMVIGVSDGDSLKVTCSDRKSAMSVRLSETDAPELAHKAFKILEQPGGKESRDALSALCLGQKAIVRANSIDRYGRTIGYVQCRGVTANEEQVRTGHAWAYLPKKGSRIPALETAARTAKIGLWAAPLPVKPSLWRKQGACALPPS